MDAISFVMGEKTSSLRVKRFSELIHGASIGKPVARKYVVAMLFQFLSAFSNRQIHFLPSFPFFFSASVTAVFELEDGSEKSFMRTVQGSSSEHRINGNVNILPIHNC